jgi:hypothetical protein
VREALGHDAAGRHLLQPVVADGRRGPQCLIRITRLELDMARREPSALRRGVSPDAGQAISLKLERYRRAVGSHRGVACPRVEAQQVLHVVAHLVRDDVGLREVARRAESLRQLLEEAKVEVDLLITRAIERARRRLGGAARGVHDVAKQYDPRPLVAAADHLLERVLHVRATASTKSTFRSSWGVLCTGRRVRPAAAD